MKYRSIKPLMLAATVCLAAGAVTAQTGKPVVCMTAFGQKEWSTLLKDVDATAKKKILEDEEFRKQQTESLRQLLAFSCEALKEGLGREETNAVELDNIRTEVIAVEYDRKVSKVKTDPPFSRITDVQVAEFYGRPANLAGFERFLKVKLELLRRNDPLGEEKHVTGEEREQAKAVFAKFKISENESIKGSAALGASYRNSVELKARMQQAQFLARLLSDVIVSKKAGVTDKDVADFIAGHSEFDNSAKKVSAQKVLERAKAGEDFAALANEFSDDPGNFGSNGEKYGGLYADVEVGKMVEPFEKASLALEPGQISPSLVETDFGFHIIKLEKKTADPGGTKYDARHILISTGYKDPDDPAGREFPVTAYVRSKLETERESAIVAQIVKENPIAIEDYKPPQPAAKKRVAGKRRR